MRKTSLILMVFLILFTTGCAPSESQSAAENPPATPAVILPMVSSAEQSSEDTPSAAESTPAVILPMVASASEETPAAGQPTPAAILPMIGSNSASAEAQAVIGDYARSVLGIEVEIKLGAGMARDLELPLAMEQDVNQALALSGISYFGVWQDGLTALSIGQGSLSGDTNADLQDGTLGIFSMRVGQAMPADAGAALALIQQTYPGLAALEFYADGTEVEAFAFRAAQSQDYSLNNGQASITGTMIRAGVSPSARPNVVIVWVVTASGALSAPWE